jgi:hypothetical protein
MAKDKPLALSMTPELARSMNEVARDLISRAEKTLGDTDRRAPVSALIVAGTLAAAFRIHFDHPDLCTCEACQDEIKKLATYVKRVGV